MFHFDTMLMYLINRKLDLYHVACGVHHPGYCSSPVRFPSYSSPQRVLTFAKSLVQEFRLWFDAARSLFLFASHLGIAIWFSCKKSSLECVSDSA
jgi:hypothetical protein